MDAIDVRELLTEQLMQKLEESKYLNVGLMNRIEGRIKSRDELVRYVELLVGKLEDTEFRSEGMIDRVDRMVGLLERLDKLEAANA